MLAKSSCVGTDVNGSIRYAKKVHLVVAECGADSIGVLRNVTRAVQACGIPDLCGTVRFRPLERRRAVLQFLAIDGARESASPGVDQEQIMHVEVCREE